LLPQAKSHMRSPLSAICNLQSAIACGVEKPPGAERPEVFRRLTYAMSTLTASL